MTLPSNLFDEFLPKHDRYSVEQTQQLLTALDEKLKSVVKVSKGKIEGNTLKTISKEDLRDIVVQCEAIEKHLESHIAHNTPTAADLKTRYQPLLREASNIYGKVIYEGAKKMLVSFVNAQISPSVRADSIKQKHFHDWVTYLKNSLFNGSDSFENLKISQSYFYDKTVNILREFKKNISFALSSPFKEFMETAAPIVLNEMAKEIGPKPVQEKLELKYAESSGNDQDMILLMLHRRCHPEIHYPPIPNKDELLWLEGTKIKAITSLTKQKRPITPNAVSLEAFRQAFKKLKSTR